MQKNKQLYLCLALAGGLAACGAESPPPPAASPASPAAPVAHLPLAQLPTVDIDAVLRHTKALSADEFEGRAPGGKGEQLTVDYLTAQFKEIGLAPGNTDGTYIQKVPLVGISGAEASPLTVAKGEQKEKFAWKDEVVAWSKRMADRNSLDNSEFVFAGYGVEAPEYGWNDFKDVDVTGKTILVFVNDPQVPDPADPAKLDAKTFGGEAMTYYGRWTYKFEEGAKRGAAGVFIVHETGPAGYPFSVVQGNLNERFRLAAPDKNMGSAAVEGWLTLDAAKKLLAMAGQDFDALKKQALSRDFKPVPLGLTASMAVSNTMRTLDSSNVVAKLEGSDPQLKDEYVVYSAHWDHLGIGAPVDGDNIYNGALDNASGVSTVLEIAKAFKQAQPPPKRSILFLMVTAEEQGLLGSLHYATSPIYPLDRTLANINLDGVTQWGRTKDITVIGLGASDLDDYLREAATEQGRTLRADPEPEKGYYYRSDHFNFAKQGVPALYTDEGIDYIGQPPEYGRQKREEYVKVDYHAPSDEVKPDWDLSGAQEDAQLLLAVGYRVANAEKYPEWKPGNEFASKRKQK